MTTTVPAPFRARVDALVAAGEVAAPSPIAADAFAEMARFAFDVSTALGLGGGRLETLDTFVAARRDFLKNKLPAPPGDLALNVWRFMVKKQRSAFERKYPSAATSASSSSSSSSSSAPTGVKRVREEDESTVEYDAGPALMNVETATKFLQTDDALHGDLYNEIIGYSKTPAQLLHFELVSTAMRTIVAHHWVAQADKIDRLMNHFENVRKDAVTTPALLALRDACRVRNADFFRDARTLVMDVFRDIANGMATDLIGYANSEQFEDTRDVRDEHLYGWALFSGAADDNPDEADLLQVHDSDEAPYMPEVLRFIVPAKSPLHEHPALIAYVAKVNARITLATHDISETHRVDRSMQQDIAQLFLGILMHYAGRVWTVSDRQFETPKRGRYGEEDIQRSNVRINFGLLPWYGIKRRARDVFDD